MEVRSAIIWINQYIDNLLQNYFRTPLCEPQRGVLKPLGEFSLLSYIMLIQRSNVCIESERIRATCQKIASTLIRERFLDRNKIEHCQVSYFLGCSINKYLIPLSDIKATVTNIPPNQAISIEHAFFMESIGISVPTNYWEHAILKILESLITEGVSRAWMYQITHVAFFVTNFGYRQTQENSTLIDIIYDLTEHALQYSFKDRNWDLATELALSLIFLRKNSVNNNNILSVLTALSEHQSSSGWILSDGELTDNIDTKNDTVMYSLFHTTTVAILLIAIYLSKNDPVHGMYVKVH